MALNRIPDIVALERKLEELKKQELYYAGEIVIASNGQQWNKIDPQHMNLCRSDQAEKLDRIVMLFVNQAVTQAAMLVIEKNRIICTEAQNSTFLIDAFRSMQRSMDSVDACSSRDEALSHPVRLIYDKPLFLTLLYRHNLLHKDINLKTIADSLIPARQQKDLAFYNEVRELLVSFFTEDIWRRDFPPLSVPCDSAELTEALAKYLDGLHAMQMLMYSGMYSTSYDPGIEAWKCRGQDIENMIRLLKERMKLLELSSRLEVPFPAAATTIALWRLGEHFPEDISYGELICIRAELDRLDAEYRTYWPKEENFRRDQLCNYQHDILIKQIEELDSLLEEKTKEAQFDWKAYWGE